MTETFRGQLADIEIEDDGDTVPIGIIDEPEVATDDNIEELRGAGPTTWQDLQRTERAVTVSGTVAEWDLETWTTLVGYDEAADELRDDAEVPTVDITVTYEDKDGDTAVFPVKEAYTDGLPAGGGREEWIGLELDFRGKTIEDVLDESSTSGSGE